MEEISRFRLLAVALAAALFAVGFSPAVKAQTAEDQEETAAEAEDEADDSDLDLIIVTGSRIASDSTLSAPSPVVSLGGEEIRTSGEIDVAALLRESPQLQAGINNAFEEEPYIGALSRPVGPRGRFFFLGANVKL